MRKLLAFALCLVLALGAVPAMAAATEAPTTYRTLYSGEVTTLNYLITATTNEFAVAANVIDTLVEYDKYGQLKPSLAESWEVSDDGLTWTFHLRKGVKWVTASGEEYAEVNANDFVDAAKYILDAQNASETADLIYNVVAGAADYYNGTATPEEGATPAPKTEWDTVGIKALDDYTLQYTLVAPTPYFLSMLTYVCYMPVNGKFLAEKGAQFGVPTGNDTLLYNGAYLLGEFKPQEKRVYVKNDKNWDAANVFITRIEETYNKEASTIAPELYKRGEVDAADIDSTIAAEWLADPATADLIHPVRHSAYSYFFCFNFDPQFDASYQPDNWKLAVNNENFRKSIYYGLDRAKAMMVIEPDAPEQNIFNTITPPEFTQLNGVDFTQISSLKAITDLGAGTFDSAKALEYRDKAVEELKAAGATFPIKVLMPYNPNTTSWAEECQVIEQQLEGLFGPDYIDVIIEAGPTSGFLSATRRAGNYALMKCNWGPDYGDPQTYTDPFDVGNNYNFLEKCDGYAAEDGNKVYNNMVNAAKAITSDQTARYNAFADAEAYLIDKAFVIPYGYGSGGYTASRLNPFDAQYAPYGLSSERFKGQSMLSAPMGTDAYYEAYDKWIAERAEAGKQ